MVIVILVTVIVILWVVLHMVGQMVQKGEFIDWLINWLINWLLMAAQVPSTNWVPRCCFSTLSSHHSQKKDSRKKPSKQHFITFEACCSRPAYCLPAYQPSLTSTRVALGVKELHNRRTFGLLWFSSFCLHFHWHHPLVAFLCPLLWIPGLFNLEGNQHRDDGRFLLTDQCAATRGSIWIIYVWIWMCQLA